MTWFESIFSAGAVRLREVLGGAPDVRLLSRLGWALLASGVLHFAVWLISGAPSLDGPVTWRKPIVFGLSGGLLALSVAWVAGLLPPSVARRRWAWTFTVTLAAEIALIDLQQWRGVASHFNLATPLDGVIFALMGGLILAVTTSVARFLVLLAREPQVSADVRVAGLFGLALVLAACATGLGILAHGQVLATAGSAGEARLAGVASSLKVPHAVALHAIQVLPILGWMLARSGHGVARRARWIAIAGTGHALFVVATVVQALLGQGRTEPSLTIAVVALTGVGLIAASVIRVLIPQRLLLV